MRLATAEPSERLDAYISTNNPQTKKISSPTPMRANEYTVALNASLWDGQAGPFLGRCTGFDAPRQMAHGMQVAVAEGSTASRKRRAIVVRGETERIAYEGRHPRDEADGGAQADDADCTYALVVFDEAQHRAALTPMPAVPMARRVRRLAGADTEAAARVSLASAEGNMQARKDLGAAFGTRKRQREIERLETNRIDASMVFGEDDTAHRAIGAEMKPGMERKQSSTGATAVVPPHHADANSIEEAYNVGEIFGRQIVEAVPVKQVIAQHKANAEELYAKMPFVGSRYLQSALRSTFDDTHAPSVARVGLLYLIGVLRVMYKNSRLFASDRGKFNARFGSDVPRVIVDKLAEMFSEPVVVPSGTAEPQPQRIMSPTMLDKLLCHMFVLCLHQDSFSVDLTLLPGDLDVPATRVAGLFRACGCRIAALTETQRTAQGLSRAEAKAYKRAVLKLPLEFPQPRRGRRD